MEEQKEKLLQWHPAFFAGIQIEMLREKRKLEIKNEYLLGTKPMQIDVLIIKKNSQKPIKKNIGRIFRTYNIVEYKSPDDYLSVDDFFKVYGYACFYKADTGTEDEIEANEITITLVSYGYPRALFQYLQKEKGQTVTRQEEGIYYISDPIFPIQVIVQKELNGEKNLWLKGLTNRLGGREEAEKLLRAYQGHDHDELYQSVMNVIMKANKKLFGGKEDMCEALIEIAAPYFEKKIEESKRDKQESLLKIVDRLVSSRKCTLEEACEIADMTVEEYGKIKNTPK